MARVGPLLLVLLVVTLDRVFRRDDVLLRRRWNLEDAGEVVLDRVLGGDDVTGQGPAAPRRPRALSVRRLWLISPSASSPTASATAPSACRPPCRSPPSPSPAGRTCRPGARCGGRR